MRYIIAIGLTVLLVITGCGKSRKSALLLERFARGPLVEASSVGQRTLWHVEPVTQSQEQRHIEVSVSYASLEYLRQFFGNRAMFGELAGPNPYFPQQLVFYVRIANTSDERIRLRPSEFTLVDDRGNQYAPLNVDYVTAYAEYRAPISTITRGILEEARPGYFGFSVPVGKLMLPRKPQTRFALIQQSSLQTGDLQPGVIHDGLVAFWSPAKDATSLRLLISRLTTDFDASDWPQTSLEFPFTFSVATADR